jgi:hypothetical protein
MACTAPPAQNKPTLLPSACSPPRPSNPIPAPPDPPQKLDRHEESLRSCLRAVDALDRLPGSSSVARWPEFMRRTPGGPNLREKLAAVRAEREEAEGKGAASGAAAGAAGGGRVAGAGRMDLS